MEVLSTEQIDALLNSLTVSQNSEKNVDTPVETTPEEAEKRQIEKQLLRNFSRILESINLKSGFKSSLPMSKNIQLELVHLEKMRLLEVLNAMPDHAILSTFKVKPLVGHCIMDIPEQIYKEIIKQNYFDCEVVDIKLSVEDIIKNILNELIGIFRAIDNKTEFTLSDIDIKNPRFSCFPSDEEVITSIYDMTIDLDGDYQCCFTLIIPMCMLNDYLELLTSEKVVSDWFYK